MGQTDQLVVSREGFVERVAQARARMEQPDEAPVVEFVHFCDVLTGLYIDLMFESVATGWDHQCVEQRQVREALKLTQRQLVDSSVRWLLSARRRLRAQLSSQQMDRVDVQILGAVLAPQKSRNEAEGKQEASLERDFRQAPVLIQASLLKLLRSQLAHAVH